MQSLIRMRVVAFNEVSVKREGTFLHIVQRIYIGEMQNVLFPSNPFHFVINENNKFPQEATLAPLLAHFSHQ